MNMGRLFKSTHLNLLIVKYCLNLSTKGFIVHHFFLSRIISFGLLFSLFFFSACSNTTPKPHSYSFGGLVTFTADEGVETSIIKSPESLHKYCAARESDAVSESQSGFSLGLGLGGKDDASATSGGAAMSLGGRDPFLLVTREFMYRVCELSLNHNLTKEETITIYKYFIDKLIVIAPLTKDDGSESKGVTTDSKSKKSSSNSIKDKDDGYDNFDIFNDKGK